MMPAPAMLPEKISHIIRPWAAQTPDHPALVDGEQAYSYAQLAALVAAARDWLAASGVRPADRVMIVGENGVSMITLLLAVSEGDAWPVPASGKLSAQEIAHITAQSDPRLVIYLSGTSRQTAAHAAAAGARDISNAALGEIAVGAMNDVAVAEPVEPGGAGQVGTMLYTTGTTGGPKGVMLTHKSLLFVAEVCGRLRNLAPADRFYAVLPVSHSVGLSTVALSTLMHGATLMLVPRFDPARTLAALAHGGVTMMHGVPAMFALLSDYARQRGIDSLKTSLKFLSVSGAPLDATVKTATERLLGVPLRQGYGITECGPTISMGRLDDHGGDLSVGRLLPGVEARLEPQEGIGELFIRGPNVMKGYFRDPEETALAIDAEGWFRTRDLARLENGRLYIVGRARELVIRGGINVYPPEVEAVLNAHPGVAQSAVVGRRVPGDEELVAFVQPAGGAALTPSELAQYATGKLAPYQLPSEIVILSTLPVSPTGKILKQQLAERLARPAQR